MKGAVPLKVGTQFNSAMLLRVGKRPQSKFYYALSTQEAKLLRIVGIMGLLALCSLAIGFALFSQQNWLVAVICVPFFIIIILHHLTSFLLLAFYPGFSTEEHRRKIAEFKKKGKHPKIAVLIPAAGEDVKLVRATVRAALKIRYPNFGVYVLDDSKDAIYKKMAKDENANYFRRKNIGEGKKSGNLNAAIAKLKGYKHALVLDADFVPRPEMLEELVPHAAEDVSIVQSPQHFDLNNNVYRRSKIEFGAGLIQRDFYRIIQVARNRFGGAICVGTNALYNLSAIRKVGGFEGHSEDVYTGLKTINTFNRFKKRYKISYVPIQLAKGLCPDTHQSFYRQQNRWATGTMQLIFSRQSLLSKNLSFAQKLCYFSNSLYYFYVIALLFTPIQLLILLLADDMQWIHTVWFIPILIVSAIILPFVGRIKIQPLALSLVMISNAYTFLQALVLLAVRRPLGWEVSGGKLVNKKSRHFTAFKVMSLLFFITIYLATLAVLIINQRIGINPATVVVSLFAFAFLGHIVYLHHTLISNVRLKRLHISKHFYTYLGVILLTILTGAGSFVSGRSYDIRASGSGLTLVSTAPELPMQPMPKEDDLQPEAPVVQTFQPIKVVAQPGDSQHKLALEIVRHIREHRLMNQATAGKLQDKVMHRMGYQSQIAAGSTYVFDEAAVDYLMLIAYVYDHEQKFWSGYAHSVGIKV